MTDAGAGIVHATAVLLGDRGVLVRGASGAGKSSLALALISSTRWRGGFARLVSDDRVELAAAGGRLLANAPKPIAGLAEVHWLGPRAVVFEAKAVIDLVVDLVEPGEALRYQEPRQVTLCGCSVPLLVLPARSVEAASAVITAWLNRPPFVDGSGRMLQEYASK